MVVLWVGTNNHEHNAEQVAGGILTITQYLRSCLPRSKVVVLVSLISVYTLMNVHFKQVDRDMYAQYCISKHLICENDKLVKH